MPGRAPRLASMTFFCLLALLLPSGCDKNDNRGARDPDISKNPAPNSKKEETKPEAEKQSKPEFVISSVELAKEFALDREKAAKKYQGKTIEIIGEIGFVYPRPSSKDVVLTLKGEKKDEYVYDYVMVWTDPKDAAVASRLSCNQKVRITGYYHVINFVATKLEELDKSTAITVSAPELAQEFAVNQGEAKKKYSEKDIIIFGEFEGITESNGFKLAILKGDGKTRVLVTCDPEFLEKGKTAHIRSRFAPAVSGGDIVIQGGQIIRLESDK